MNDVEKGISEEFNVAQRSNEDQKREFSIQSISNRSDREAIEAAVDLRDKTLELQAAELAKERERLAVEKIAKELKPENNLDYNPPGGGLDYETRKAAIHSRVEYESEPLHTKQINAMRRDLNEQIDQKIAEAHAKAATQGQSEAPAASILAENWKKAARAAKDSGQSDSESQNKGKKPKL